MTNSNVIQWIGNSTNTIATGATYAYWPVQLTNPPSTPDDEISWLRRRVREITDLVAVA